MSQLLKSVTWTEMKALIAAGGLVYKYFDFSTYYLVYAVDNPFIFEATILKDSGSDHTEFDASYKTSAFPTISQFDVDGATIVRNKAAKKGWSFCSLPVEFETARLSDTMFAQDYQGNNRTYFTMKAYNDSDVEVTTPGLDGINYGTIVKTVIDFEPPFDYEIIGGDLRTFSAINTDIRLWIVAVPDIPAGSGGSKEMGGGVNLKFLTPGNVFSVDGRVSKYATYNATYHTNKIRMIFKYPAGVNENIAVAIQLYKA